MHVVRALPMCAPHVRNMRPSNSNLLSDFQRKCRLCKWLGRSHSLPLLCRPTFAHYAPLRFKYFN